jgi:hypothetical protein
MIKCPKKSARFAFFLFAAIVALDNFGFRCMIEYNVKRRLLSKQVFQP